MEQGKHTDAEENKLGQRIPYDCQEVRMVRGVEPAERKRNSEQQQQHGQYERGRHAPGAEQQPQEWLR
jgi:hypothetical protein